jgi:hypothetical protein
VPVVCVCVCVCVRVYGVISDRKMVWRGVLHHLHTGNISTIVFLSILFLFFFIFPHLLPALYLCSFLVVYLPRLIGYRGTDHLAIRALSARLTDICAVAELAIVVTLYVIARSHESCCQPSLATSLATL